MRFRHPEGVRVASTSGHVALIGPEWTELNPILHADALAAGCECDKTVFRAEPVVPAPPTKEAAARQDSPDQVIREALELMLARNEDGDFTKDNLPNVNVLAKLAGMTVRKEDALRVFRGMQSEAAE